jgi:hypothetical protein
MAEYWAAAGWGVCVLLALMGWGRLALRAAGATGIVAWLEAAAWGIAISSLVGGLMNLLAWCGRAGVITFVLLGLLLFLADATLHLPRARAWWRTWPGRRDVAWIFVAALVAALLTLRFLSSLSAGFNPKFEGVRLNPHDDMHSYLVSVERLLQTGTLGHDPFNSRMMMSALGTQHFLNALVLAGAREERLHLLEGGIALAALCMSAAALGLRLGLRRVPATALMLVPLMIQFGYINLSATVTAAAAVMVLVSWGLSDIRPGGPALLRWSVLLGFLLAAACSLKGTVLFVSCVFAFAVVLLRALGGRRPTLIAAGALALAVAAACLLPWMLWQHASSGTWLYPLLGRGYHAAVFGLTPFPKLPSLPAAAANALRVGLVLPIVLLAAALVAAALPRPRRLLPSYAWAGLVAYLAAWTCSWPVMAQATQVVDLPRYLAASAAVGCTLALAAGWRIAAAVVAERPAHPARFAGPAAFAAFAVLTAGEWAMLYFVMLPADLARATSNQHPIRGAAGAIAARLRDMQNAVPPGEKLLVYLAEPAFLDFRRNPIYVVDWPGEASPPPGMPVYSGGPAVADYLRHLGIRYVAYDYARHAAFPPENYSNYLAPLNGDVVRRQAAGSFAFQDDLHQMEARERIIYRNGEEEILDLGPAAPRN